MNVTATGTAAVNTRALQTLREVRGRPAVATAFGVRVALAPLSDGVRFSTPTRRQPEGTDTFVRGISVRVMTLYRNASDFIPLTIISLTDLAVFNATGLAEIRLVALESDLSRRNQMKAEGARKTGVLLCVSAPCP